MNELAGYLKKAKTWLYELDKQQRLPKSTKGYDVDACREVVKKGLTDEGRFWDTNYKKYRALRERREYLNELEKLVLRKAVVQETIKRDLAFKKAVLHLIQTLPHKLAGLDSMAIGTILEEEFSDMLNGLAKAV